MNSIIYEINTRVWIKRFSQNNVTPKLIDIPNRYWETLVSKGIDYVWLMGIWETVHETIDKYCFEDGLVNEYKKALPNWTSNDVIGSPYAINNYSINNSLASTSEFIKFKANLNQLGLKIILDFIPNHFSVATSLLKTNPEIFLHGNEELLFEDASTFFKVSNGSIYAHGRDPNFSAWQDTIQVNYFSEVALKFMTNSLVNIAKLCNGVRCDMAMLVMNNVFQRTWQKPLSMLGVTKTENEFWDEAIKKTKEIDSDFLFIAEAYWDTEWQLQHLGFDVTYDKRLFDRLEFGDAEIILKHLNAESKFQQKSLRFIENHDENRAITTFGIAKLKAAAIIMCTIEGSALFYDGQFEGKSTKLPVQLGREPNEKINNSLVKFYDNLLKISNHPVFIDGTWNLLTPIKLDNDFTYKNILAWEWVLGNEKRVVVINYSTTSAHCRIKFGINSSEEKTTFIDLLDNQAYERDRKEIIKDGLFIHLENFESHIFKLFI